MNFPIPRLNEIIKAPEGIISVWGDFGIGKTTFALQTAINTANQGKNVIYIYSKPNFPYVRVGDILKDDPKETLDNIVFIKSTNFADLYNLIFNLEFLVLESVKEKGNSFDLIVVDSITDLYRLELNKEKKEKNVSLNYRLNQILANLSYIYKTYCITVLLVNELARKSYINQTVEVQGGGKVMMFWILYTIKIERTEVLNIRKLIIRKRLENKKIELSSSLTKHGFE
ncbi:MAG: AAA family ATPase [Candidatus Hodarchaeota archaeon]